MITTVALVGALTGLHAASWGAFKDSPFEGFCASKFARSVLLGLAAAYAVHRLFGIDDLLVLIGLAYATERLGTEWWKAILRNDPQDAYTIPMRLAVLGRPVDRRSHRYLAGLLILGGLFGVLALATAYHDRLSGLPPWVLALLGGVGGWLTAFGGAWKDAPIEGFETRKFFRSPVVATLWAAVLVPFTGNLPVLAVAAGGWSVITIETYKTFLAGGAPGKFGDKPARFPADRVRRACRTLHGGLYAVLTGALVVAVLEAPLPEATGDAAQTRAQLLALLVCSGYAAVVLWGRRQGDPR